MGGEALGLVGDVEESGTLGDVEGTELLGELGLSEALVLLLDGLLGLALDDAEVCGALGLLTGPVGVPEGVLLGLVDGVVGPLDGELLGGLLEVPPEPPTPLMETVWPLGSKRTCAVHGPFGSAEESTKTWIEIWPPPASIPEVALRLSHGASGVALQLTGEVPEFQRVTSTSPGSFERCDTLMCSCPSPLGSCDGAEVCDGSGSTGPLKGGLLGAVGAEDDDGVFGRTAATTCAVTLSPFGTLSECTLPATGSAGPACELEPGRG